MNTETAAAIKAASPEIEPEDADQVEPPVPDAVDDDDIDPDDAEAQEGEHAEQ